ncbi:MAG: carboxypeptidase-like regulatory domain-containing protein [Vicinamibacterales bacterium]
MPDPTQMSGVPLPAPELPDSTVTVRVVRERMGNNLSGQTVTLRGGGISKTAITDAQGRAQFDGLPPGASVTAEATVQGEVLTSQAFPVPARGGVRIALVAGLAGAAAAERAAAEAAAKEPPRRGVVEFGGESRIIFEYQNDVLNGFYLLEVVNNARTPIETGGPLLLELPRGAAGASTLEGSSQQVSVRGEHVTITGPFAPGKTPVQLGFSLPNAGASLTIRQMLPAALNQVFVAAEKIGPMELSSPQLRETREITSQGQVFLMGTGDRVNAGDTLVLQLSGLPAKSLLASYAVFGLAVAILVIGIGIGITTPEPQTAEDAKLTAKRDRLMGELVSLERKRRAKGLSGPDDARRQKVLTDLERAWAALDQVPGPGGEGRAA